MHSKLTWQNLYPAITAEKDPHLVQDTNAATDCGGDGCPSEPEFRKRSKAEDEARIKQQINEVRKPKYAHRDRGVSSSPKDPIVQEQKDDRDGAAHHDGRIVPADCNDIRRRPHDLQ